MFRNVIVAGNSQENAIKINVIGGERGDQGEKGPQGDPGVSIASLYKQNGNLYIELTNGQVIDAGELPTEDLTVQYVGEMDGTNQTYAISPAVDPNEVKFVLINGVVYTSGYNLTQSSITFSFDNDLIPSGRLELAIFEGAS